MKTVSDDLFRLIKSLNKSEKGYFKKFAAKNATGGKQNYIFLFDAIDAMNEYDEELLKKKLKDPSLLKQLPVYKVYLFNLILKTLNLYGAYDNSESQLNELLANIRILTSKHHYREARKVIKKAKEMAYKFDKHKFMMELLSAERHILMLSPVKNITEKRLALYEEQQDLLDRMKEFYDVSLLCDRMTILVDNEADFRSNEKSAQVEEIMTSSILNPGQKLTGYYAQMNYYHTHLIYSGSKGDNIEILKNLKQQIAYDEANRHFIEENPQNYVYALINLLLYSHYAKDNHEIERTLVKLEAVKKKMKGKIARENEIQIMFHASNVEMIIFEKTCDLVSGRAKAKQIEEDFRTYGNEVPFHVKALMLLNLACFNIIDENYPAAIKYLNTILNTQELSIRTDVNKIARILQLVIHYEMKNFDLLEYLQVAAKKFLGAKLSKFEQVLMKFFGSIIKHPAEKHPAIFDELTFALKRAQDSNGILNYFDFLSWAKAHAEGKKLIEVLKENLKEIKMTQN
ncbi:MAG: hypothetical protein HOP31_00405 [Ignavibacteria bacterium]|nr:hypothetical protein [Ignavibacteria bacterium]